MTEVSVVIPTHERGAFVREAVRSALAQSPNADVIVVRSHGDTAAARLDQDFPNVTVLECAGERAAARNAGLAKATSEWVLFLDDDDLLLRGALATLLATAKQHDADVVRGERVEFEDGTEPRGASPANATTRRLEREDLITGAEILTPSQTLYRRAALPDDPFPETFVPVEDYALGSMLALRGARVIATDVTTTAYRRHPDQSVGRALSPQALQRRRAVVDELSRQLRGERRLQRRVRAHHELYSRTRTELSAGHRLRAFSAVLSAAAWWPALLGEAMWWRAAAHAAARRTSA